jgi:hypothetical protein
VSRRQQNQGGKKNGKYFHDFVVCGIGVRWKWQKVFQGAA